VILLRVVSPLVEYTNGATYTIYTPTDTPEEVIGADQVDARHYLKDVAASSVLEGVHTQLEIYTGMAAPMILAVTASEHIDMIVMSSHGRTGFKRWLLGSVAQNVARHSPVPVLLLREREAMATGLHPYMEHPLRVLVPLDGSLLAKAALLPAIHVIAALAAPGQGAIHLVRVVKLDTLPGEVLDPEDKEHMLHRAKTYLQSVVGHLREGLAAELHVAVTWSVALDRDAATGIIRVAENGEDAEGAGVFGACNMIALSTHGRGGLQRWAMGSVAERVASGTRLPVLIVQPQQVESETSEAKIRQAEVRR
jgi:nucleotide-binding universal stress UspA family protein